MVSADDANGTDPTGYYAATEYYMIGSYDFTYTTYTVDVLEAYNFIQPMYFAAFQEYGTFNYDQYYVIPNAGSAPSEYMFDYFIFYEERICSF